MDGFFFQQFVGNDIAVFWDIEDCKIPDGSNVGDVAAKIKSALGEYGCVGPVVSMMAFGDMKEMEDEFSSAGIRPIHVDEAGVKERRLRRIQIEMMNWVIKHRFERSNLLLIMGDMSRDFVFIRSLFHLKMKNFNILLSQPEGVSGQLLAAAPLVWYWSSLAVGGAPIPQNQLHELMCEDIDFDGYCSQDDDD